MATTQASGNKTPSQTYSRLNNSLNYAASEGNSPQLDAPAAIQVVVLSFIIIAGFFGNFLVVGVVLRERLMRTRTNWFLVVLAIDHIGVVIFCAPFMLASTVKGEWIFGDAACKLNGFMNAFWFTSTIFTLTVISVHKYFSVVKPLRRIITRRRAILMIILVGLGAFSCAIGPLIGWGSINFNVVSSMCGPDNSYEIPRTVYVIFLMSIAYAIPVLIMGFLYWRIFKAVNLHCHRIRDTAIIDVRGVLTQKQMITTLFIILTTFIVCWTPFFVYAVIMLATDFSGTSFSRPFLRAAYICGFLHSILNPVVLGARNPRFRRGFKEIVQCKWVGKAHDSTTSNGNIPGRAVRPSVDYLAERRCSVWYLSTQQSLLSLEQEKPQRRLKLRWIETNL